MLSERSSDSCTVGVGTSEANSKAFSFANFASGFILVPSTESSVDLTFYASRDEAGPFVLVTKHDATTALTVSTTGSRAKEMPPQLFACHWLKIVASAISSGTTIPYTVIMKA